MPSPPSVSFVIATYNRRDVLLSTLQRLQDTAAPEAGGTEIIVVDNASSDQTAAAVRSQFPDVQLIPLTNNLGSCAKAIGIERASADYVVFLDDDSYPQPGSVRRMLAKFPADAQLGAAAFVVHLPNGQCESSALPNVFVGCGAGFRRDALREVGGLDATFFMQAEEYDLSFRLVTAGWKVETFPDLHVDHLKTPCARIGRRTVYYDTLNNLRVAARYLPDDHETALRHDWSQRYHWIARAAGHTTAYWRGRLRGWLRHDQERRAYAKWRLSREAFEYLFRFGYIERQMSAIADNGVRTIVLADLGKNIRPFVESARTTGLRICCIADDLFAQPGRRYQSIPIRPVCEALNLAPDAIVVSNASPVHATATATRLASLVRLPIHRWFGYDIPPR